MQQTNKHHAETEEESLGESSLAGPLIRHSVVRNLKLERDWGYR